MTIFAISRLLSKDEEQDDAVEAAETPDAHDDCDAEGIISCALVPTAFGGGGFIVDCDFGFVSDVVACCFGSSSSS